MKHAFNNNDWLLPKIKLLKLWGTRISGGVVSRMESMVRLDWKSLWAVGYFRKIPWVDKPGMAPFCESFSRKKGPIRLSDIQTCCIMINYVFLAAFWRFLGCTYWKLASVVEWIWTISRKLDHLPRDRDNDSKQIRMLTERFFSYTWLKSYQKTKHQNTPKRGTLQGTMKPYSTDLGNFPENHRLQSAEREVFTRCFLSVLSHHTSPTKGSDQATRCIDVRCAPWWRWK